MGGIYPVCNCNKPDTISRKYLAEVTACFYVFTSKPGEVFYDHAVDFSLPYVLHHGLELRTVKQDSAVAVIHMFRYKFDFRVSFQKILYQFFLVGENGATLEDCLKRILI